MNIKNIGEGALYGAVFSAVIGQIPPLTALPEEIFSIPTGAVIGAMLGGRKVKKLLRF